MPAPPFRTRLIELLQPTAINALAPGRATVRPEHLAVLGQLRIRHLHHCSVKILQRFGLECSLHAGMSDGALGDRGLHHCYT
jgi:hypothetical protein